MFDAVGNVRTPYGTITIKSKEESEGKRKKQLKQSIGFLNQGTKSGNHSKVECKSILIHGIIITLKATLDPSFST